MRSTQNKNKFYRSRKTILPLAALLIVAGTGTALALVHSHTSTPTTSQATAAKARTLNSIDYSPASASDNVDNENRKENPSSSQPTLDSQKAADFNVSVTQAAVDTSNHLLRVRTLIEGATSGDCELVLSHAGQSDISATSTVTLQNNAYACENFDIPFSRFPQRGDWHVSVKVNHNSTVATGSWPETVTIPAS